MEEMKQISLAFFLSFMMEIHTIHVQERIPTQIGVTLKLMPMALELQESGDFVILVATQVRNIFPLTFPTSSFK